MRKASSGYFAFSKACREGQRPRCPIRRHTGNEDVAPPMRLNPVRSSLEMVWLNFERSSHCQFQETIVPQVALVPHVPPRHLQSAKPKACREGQRPRCPIRVFAFKSQGSGN